MGEAEPALVDKVITLHDALETHDVRHAFGGALALAYYTHDPRTTADIDVNVSLSAAAAHHLLGHLPSGIAWSDADVARTKEDEQVRLWWGRTPVDLFFRASSFHDGVADRAQWHEFGPTTLPFLAADDLAVFKALFDRPKDWLDIAAMVAAGSVDLESVIGSVHTLIGDDTRVHRLGELRI